jgi:CHAD domain-containing protein/transposase-like protein
MSISLLSDEHRQQIQHISEQPEEESIHRRARLLLLYDQGLATRQVASQVGLSAGRVRYWRRAYQRRGLGVFRSLASLPQAPAAAPEAPPAGPVDKARHLAETALALFDAARPAHQLDEGPRRLLEAAARLSQVKRKAKSARAAILAQPLAGFTPAEQAQVAGLVAALLSGREEDLAAEAAGGPLGEQQLLTLLAVLRIAAGLDVSGSQATRLGEVTLSPGQLYIQVSGPASLADATAAQSQAGLWGRLFSQGVHVYGGLEIDPEQARRLADELKAPGIQPDDPMSEAGRKVLRYHFIQMLANEPGTRLGEDIEALHDMRVATRRMRAAFDVFGEYYRPKALKAHLKGLRAAGRALGKVRDLDVFMEKAGHYQAGLPEAERPDLAPLLEVWQEQRQAARQEMLAHLDSPQYQAFVRGFNLFLNTPGAGTLEVDPGHPAPSRVREVAPAQVYERLAAVRAYAPLLDSASLEQLHALRIEFKRLRYTLEFFREVLGPEAKAVIEETKLIQDHLGDLNDANVACAILSEFLAGWDERQADLPLGERHSPEALVAYLAYRHAERHRLLLGFAQAWAEFHREQTRRSLALAVAIL